MSLVRSVSDTSNWWETPGQTQNLLSDLGTPLDPPGGAGKHYWVQGHLDCFAQPAAPPDPAQAAENGWMEDFRLIKFSELWAVA